MGIWQIYIRDLEGIVYWGTGSYIGDLAGIQCIYCGYGKYSILGIWQVYWKSVAGIWGIWQEYWHSWQQLTNNLSSDNHYRYSLKFFFTLFNIFTLISLQMFNKKQSKYLFGSSDCSICVSQVSCQLLLILGQRLAVSNLLPLICGQLLPIDQRNPNCWLVVPKYDFKRLKLDSSQYTGCIRMHELELKIIS